MTREEIRIKDRQNIRNFVEDNAHLLMGKVLDFGAGKQPYKDLVRGEYHAYDPHVAGMDDLSGEYNAILCTQVVQEAVDPKIMLEKIYSHLKNPGGHLIMTYPAAWEEYGGLDSWRFTQTGMARLLSNVGFVIEDHRCIHDIPFDGWALALQYGVVCRR